MLPTRPGCCPGSSPASAATQIAWARRTSARGGSGAGRLVPPPPFGESGGPARRPAVQVGDPFTEKIVIEACLELFDRDLVVGVQDLSGGRLTFALYET